MKRLLLMKITCNWKVMNTTQINKKTWKIKNNKMTLNTTFKCKISI